MLPHRADFPPGFLFGVSTSAYQIEGHAQGGAGRTQWDDFAATPGNVVRAENGALACDHLNRWQDDLNLISAANMDVYRFSASWARVVPEGRGAANPEGLDFYDRLIDGLLERGIKPALTLYHWELPSPLLDAGGWRNRDIASWFADYAEVLLRRVGDRTWSVAPINEPWCVAWLSHFMGLHAPGVRDIRAAGRAMHHVGLGHGRAIAAMRALGVKNLGAVCNHEFSAPADDTPEAAERAAIYDGIYNRWFAGAFFNGSYPADVLAGLEPFLPKGWENDMAGISAPLDWLGINYYTRKLIGPDEGPWPALKEVEGPLPKTQMGWEIYPEGLAFFLRRAHADYTRGLPIYVTENGLASPDVLNGNRVEDEGRIAFIGRHLDAVRQVIAEGVPVSGYFTWSLMDNYEWSLGYEKRFGLVHVDFETLDRTPKASYHALAAALARAET